MNRVILKNMSRHGRFGRLALLCAQWKRRGMISDELYIHQHNRIDRLSNGNFFQGTSAEKMLGNIKNRRN